MRIKSSVDINDIFDSAGGGYLGAIGEGLQGYNTAQAEAKALAEKRAWESEQGLLEHERAQELAKTAHEYDIGARATQSALDTGRDAAGSKNRITEQNNLSAINQRLEKTRSENRVKEGQVTFGQDMVKEQYKDRIKSDSDIKLQKTKFAQDIATKQLESNMRVAESRAKAKPAEIKNTTTEEIDGNLYKVGTVGTKQVKHYIGPVKKKELTQEQEFALREQFKMRFKGDTPFNDQGFVSDAEEWIEERGLDWFWLFSTAETDQARIQAATELRDYMEKIGFTDAMIRDQLGKYNSVSYSQKHLETLSKNKKGNKAKRQATSNDNTKIQSARSKFLKEANKKQLMGAERDKYVSDKLRTVLVQMGL